MPSIDNILVAWLLLFSSLSLYVQEIYVFGMYVYYLCLNPHLRLCIGEVEVSSSMVAGTATRLRFSAGHARAGDRDIEELSPPLYSRLVTLRNLL